MNVGITFGCYAPLHSGHLGLIDKALEENDKAIIAVCGRMNDRGKDFIPFEDRIELVRQRYGDDDRITIVILDDDKLFMDGTFTLENWIRWSAELFRQSGYDPNDANTVYRWYMGEKSYQEKLLKIYPNHIIGVTDRAINPISATKIRENPNKYADEVAPEFRDYLARKGIITNYHEDN